jgi:hypothetical protein
MRRREVIAVIGAAATWPVVARAQESDRVRRIGLLVGLAEDDAGMKPRLIALRQELEALGWVEGRNVRVQRRYAPGGAGAQELAKELVALQPDVIVAHTVSVAAALKQETSAIPIVFVSVGDPLGAGFIASLARPGGTLTGLMTFEAGISGKWVEMLKEVMPGLIRAMFVANPKTTTYGYYLAAASAAARTLALDLMPARVESEFDLERSIGDFAREPGGACPWECHRCTRGPAPRAGRLCLQLPRCGWWSHVIRDRSRCRDAPGGVLCGPDPTRRRARRSAGADTDQIRDSRQFKSGESAWPHHPAVSPRPRR